MVADSASAVYLWSCLVDAMAEFGGRPVGLTALKTLAVA
jgi:glycine cleavage system aminomethyltransferase T